MKAWYLSTVDGDNGYFCVFADTRNQARAQADSNDMFYDSWLDITATRFKGMDNKENLTKREFDYELWRNHGWNWIDYDAPDEAETTDAQFYEWYDKTFGGDKS